jgi:aminoglycoside phosphotransferase family enzyme
MRVLRDRRLGLPAGLVTAINRTQRRFLAQRSALIAGRLRARHIVDGHGDLRPEHIWLGPPVRIIDGLEFNPGLRAVDPFDEIAFLCLECERLGCAWAAEHIRRRACHLLPDAPPDALFTFYRCYRASMRARLAAAHLLEAAPRTPAKWRRQAHAYLRLAAADARRLERFLGPSCVLKTPSGR